MNNRRAQLQAQIGELIEQLQKIQRNIAASRQPPSKFELESLQEIGVQYAKLQRQLEDWCQDSAAGDGEHEPTR